MPVNYSNSKGRSPYKTNVTTEDKVRKYLTQVPSVSATMRNQTTTRGTQTQKAKTTTKPTLTASQAVSAVKNGNITQSVVDAYNYYYGTNYTINTLPKMKTTKK